MCLNYLSFGKYADPSTVVKGPAQIKDVGGFLDFSYSQRASFTVPAYFPANQHSTCRASSTSSYVLSVFCIVCTTLNVREYLHKWTQTQYHKSRISLLCSSCVSFHRDTHGALPVKIMFPADSK